MIKKIIFLFASMMVGTLAHADDIRLGEPQYGGTGCPDGTAHVIFSPDEKTLSVLFDSYVVEAGGINKALDRKNCGVAIPIHIPQGYSVAILGIDYRGFMSLPRGGRSSLNVDYFLAGGGRGVRTSKTFSGPMSDDYLKTDNLSLEAVVWTPCGADTILRTNTTLLVQTNRQRDEAMATLDSMDVQSGLVYHVAWRTCR